MRNRAFFALPAFVLVANLGCGRSAEERQLESMRDEIDKVREGRDRADRSTNPRDTDEPPLVVPLAYTSAERRPPPPVVQIGADDPSATDYASEAADPQDTTPRPSIRIFGSSHGGGRNARRDDQFEQVTSDDGTVAAGSAARADSALQGSPARDRNPLDPDAKRAYDAAFSLVTAKRFDAALDAFAAFLVRWPDHPYADNAMYWRGECYFARGDYAHAAEQFDGVLKRFPAGNKAPDALLKLGMSHEKLGNAVTAKESFDRLVQQFPDSDAARRIGTPRAHTGTPPGPPAVDSR